MPVLRPTLNRSVDRPEYVVADTPYGIQWVCRYADGRFYYDKTIHFDRKRVQQKLRIRGVVKRQLLRRVIREYGCP